MRVFLTVSEILAILIVSDGSYKSADNKTGVQGRDYVRVYAETCENKAVVSALKDRSDIELISELREIVFDENRKIVADF